MTTFRPNMNSTDKSTLMPAAYPTSGFADMRTERYGNYTLTSNSVINYSSTDDRIQVPGDGEADLTRFDDYLWIYVSPFILILGLIGNVLTLAVMRRKHLRGTTTSVYMPVMSVFDTIALTYGIAPEWFHSMGIIYFREQHPVVCKLEKFIFYTTSDTAIWVLVLFTVDRFVAVCFPLHKSRICVPRRAKIACISLFVCSVIKNVHVFWTRGAVYRTDGSLFLNCGKPEPYTDFEQNYRPWLAFVLISVLPFCILLLCNCFIIWTLTNSRSVQMRKMDATAEKTKVFTQTTMMCLSASFVFLVCVIPSIVLLIGKQHWTGNNAYEVAKAVTNQLSYLNHSINFFLYCLTGQKFRTELVAMLAQVRHSMHFQDTTSRTSHTFITRSTLPLTVHAVNCQVIDPVRTDPKVQSYPV